MCFTIIFKKEKNIQKGESIRMKKILFVKFSLLFVGVLLVQNSFAQDSPQWHLPEGVIARIGKGETHDIQYSPDGTQLMVACTIGIWIYDTVTGQPVDLLTGHMGTVNSVVFNPDGDIMASASDDHTIRLWDAQTGKHERTLTGHTGRVLSVAFSPDGKTIVSGGALEAILWDARTGKHKRTLSRLRRNLVQGHHKSIVSVAFSPDGKTIATGSVDFTIRLWDAYTGENKRTLFGSVPTPFASVAFSPDSSTLAGAGGGAISFWDVRTGNLKVVTRGNATDLLFSSDGNTIIGACKTYVGYWDVNTGREIKTLGANAREISFSPDGRTLASVQFTSSIIEFWDVKTNKQLKQRKITGHSRRPQMSFSPDGNTLVTQGSLWDANTGRFKRNLGMASFERLAFSPDGNTLASGYWGTIRFWNVHTGEFKPTLTSSCWGTVDA